MSQRTPLIEEARSRRGDTVQLGITAFHVTKRSVALLAMNQDSTLREVVIRALEREVSSTRQRFPSRQHERLT